MKEKLEGCTIFIPVISAKIVEPIIVFFNLLIVNYGSINAIINKSIGRYYISSQVLSQHATHKNLLIDPTRELNSRSSQSNKRALDWLIKSAMNISKTQYFSSEQMLDDDQSISRPTARIKPSVRLDYVFENIITSISLTESRRSLVGSVLVY